MKIRTLLFLALAVLFVGCGNQNDSRLSDSDIAYLKTQRYSATASTTVTVTSTSTSTVTASVTTVTSSSTH